MSDDISSTPQSDDPETGIGHTEQQDYDALSPAEQRQARQARRKAFLEGKKRAAGAVDQDELVVDLVQRMKSGDDAAFNNLVDQIKRLGLG